MERNSSIFPTISRSFCVTRLAVLLDEASGKSALVAPAKNINVGEVNRIIGFTGGTVFVAISSTRASGFLLPQMSRPKTKNTKQIVGGSQMLVSVEAREGVSTGISAADRARTISILGEDQVKPERLVQPGHIFPLQVADGSLLTRNGIAEGAFDLVNLSKLGEAAVFVDLLGPNGDYLSLAQSKEFAESQKLPLIGLSDLTRHRLETESLIERVAETRLPTEIAGELKTIVYRSRVHQGEHLALIKGTLDLQKPVLVRVQREFTFSDVFGGGTPPSRNQLRASLSAIGQRGSGVLVYLRTNASGQLSEQITRAQDAFAQKPAAMMREYGIGAQILRDLGIRSIELLTTSSKKLEGLTTFGIEIVAQLPLDTTHEPSLLC